MFFLTSLTLTMHVIYIPVTLNRQQNFAGSIFPLECRAESLEVTDFDCLAGHMGLIWGSTDGFWNLVDGLGFWCWRRESNLLLTLDFRTSTAWKSCLQNKVLYIIMKLRCPLQRGPSDEQPGKVTPGKDLPWSAPGHAGPGSRRPLSPLWYPPRASPSQGSTVTVHKSYHSSCIKQ